MSRFFGMRWAPARTEAEVRARAMAASLTKAGFAIALDWRGIIILTQDDVWREPPITVPHGAGFVFGVLFEQAEQGLSRRVTLFERDIDAMIAAGGEAFCRTYWGNYVAVLIDRAHDIVKIIRDPMGGRACFCAEDNGLHYFCADVADLALVRRCAPRADRVLAFLGYAHLVTRDTGLSGVTEVLAGEQLTLTRSRAYLEQVWRPPPAATYVADAPKFADSVTTTARMVAHAWVGVKPRVAHRLSGGLDSSAVLALLSDCEPSTQIMCVNERSIAAPEGDESAHARAVAAHFGARYEEAWIDPREVDYRCLSAAPLLASPSMTLLSFAGLPYPDIDGALLTSGQGGDQIFFRSRSSLIAADVMRTSKSPARWAKAIYETARCSGLSVWHVGRAAITYGMARRGVRAEDYFEAGAPLGGQDGLCSAAALQMRHPWLADWRHTPPAYIKRILAVLDAAQYFWPNGLNCRHAAAPVLLSQPLVEHLLRAPSALFVHGGQERGLFKLAFRGVIPDDILWRVGKGQTTRHFAEILEQNRNCIIETVREGELLKSGVFDRATVAAMMQRREVVETSQIEDWLKAFVAELWHQRWAGVASAASASGEVA